MVEIDDRLFQYICVFCNDEKKFSSKIEACIHYAIHFNYNPVICMLCEHKFIDFSLLVKHYNTNHSEFKNNIFHYLSENEKIEKWINQFLDFQKTHEFNGKLSAVFGDFCFVCEKLFKRENGLKLNCEKNNIKAIRDHINQHLHYFPYQCSICFHGGRIARFSTLYSSAVEHLVKVHNLDKNGIQLTNLLKLFVKSDEVLDLEKFIDNKIFPKRRQISETPLTLNMKRKLEEIETENQKMIETRKRLEVDIPKRLETTTTPNPVLTNRLQTLPLFDKQNQYLSLIKRLENNGMPTPSALNNSVPNSHITLKTNGYNTAIRVTPKLCPKPRPMPIEYIPSKQTYVDPFLFCFHCHTKVANTCELESHHQSKHPKLTIASYAPTRKDIPVINLT